MKNTSDLIEHVNIGIRPLGRGAEPSAAILKEIQALKTFVNDAKSFTPVNNMGNALKYRQAHLNFLENMGQSAIAERMKKIYLSLSLPIS